MTLTTYDMDRIIRQNPRNRKPRLPTWVLALIALTLILAVSILAGYAM